MVIILNINELSAPSKLKLLKLNKNTTFNCMYNKADINKWTQIGESKRIRKIYQANTSHEKAVYSSINTKQSRLQGKDQIERHFIMIHNG